MNFDLNIGLKMEKAACAFLHLASTSSSVPPVVAIRLPRYVKAVILSRLSPPQLMVPVFAGDRILISLVLAAFTLGGSLFLQRLELLSHVSDLLAQQNHVIAKSKSFNFRNGVSWIPVSLSPSA